MAEPRLGLVLPFADLLVGAAAEAPDHRALVFPERSVTYSELYELAIQRAVGLRNLGVKRGDHVGILMANCVEYMEVLFATQLLGAVAVTLNARYRARELTYVIENADLDVLVTSDLVADHVDYVERIGEALPLLPRTTNPFELDLDEAPKLRSCVLLGSTPAHGFAPSAVLSPEVTDADRAEIEESRRGVSVRSPAIMMYTSGTTAHPKGCPLSHEVLVRTGYAMAEQRYLLSEADVFWDPLPMFHMSSILPITATFATRGTFVSLTHFDVDTAVDQIIRERPTGLFPSFPTLAAALVAHERWSEVDVDRIRVVNNVAPADALRQFQAAYPNAIQTAAYGLTEAGGVIAFNDLTDTLEQRVTTCGRPFDGIDVRIVDPDTGSVVPQGERGEIQIKGYCLFEGYYRDPDKTNESMVDGWLRTGDICSLDPDGRISYHGRLKDMLKVGGENVAAVEIESFLSTHPAIKLVQVVAAPDETYVEVPAAFVELHEPGTLDEAGIVEFCEGQMASFKVPRYVRFVEDWPMSATKIQKYQLRDRIAAEVAGS
jgi:acyl-CoA synthetase (AMP-forming)/AMP-acid ligase II